PPTPPPPARPTSPSPPPRQAPPPRAEAPPSSERVRAEAPPPSGRPRRGTANVSGAAFQRVAVLTAAETTPVAALAFARGGRLLMAGHLDGGIALWDVAQAMPVTALSFGMRAGSGVLQDVRLSPDGTFAAAWGLQLGTRVWRVAGAQPLWTAGFSSPSGLMDLTLGEQPDTAYLALPDAPPALGDDDPFRWAHDGRGGTAIFARSLGSPVTPADTIPLRCIEPGGGRGGPLDVGPRVQLRQLSSDGRLLLTASITRTARGGAGRVLHLWDLEHHALLGAAHPRRQTVISAKVESAQFPIAATDRLTHVAVTVQSAALRVYALTGRVAATDVPTGTVPEDAQLAISPDGRLIALVRAERLDLWQVAGGRHLQRWAFDTPVAGLAFAPATATPTRLAIGLRNGIAEVWEAAGPA
ncbi:MAG: WD40 repeat domain-containing protein, partial [Ktedonobacterales bacterium]